MTDSDSKPSTPIVSPRKAQTRREFIRSAVLTAGVVGLSLVGLVPSIGGANARLRPPGALKQGRDEHQLLAACIKCGQCVQVCPVEAIHLADLNDGVGVGVPFIDARAQACDFSCDGLQCVLACPTGALTHDLDFPADARMGFARVARPDACLAAQGKGFKGLARGADFRGELRYAEVDRWNPIPVADHPYDLELCDLCVRQCPIEIRIVECAAQEPREPVEVARVAKQIGNECPPRHAIALERTADGAGMIPVVQDGCVGCGVCEMICPVESAAIVVDFDRDTDHPGGARVSYIIESLRQLVGAKPSKPVRDDIPVEVRTIYADKRKEKLTAEALHAVEHKHAGSPDRHKWRNRRWATLIVVNLLFVVSFYFDVQLVEGALTGSRFVGFHMADLNSALQVMLAYKHVVLNLVIGTTTVFVLWLLLGGRTFCSWVCPYHLIAEWAESLRLKLEGKGWVKDIQFHRGVRTVFYVIFALLAVATGYTIFETLSPTGILSRALIYGPGLALLWVLALLLFELLVSRRAWCRYVCPIGMTYRLVGLLSPVRVQYNVQACHHEGDCRKVCLVPHVLDVTIRGRARAVDTDIGADCTRCGLCVDICPTSSLSFKVKGLDKALG